jgi:hypothetical protein
MWHVFQRAKTTVNEARLPRNSPQLSPSKTTFCTRFSPNPLRKTHIKTTKNTHSGLQEIFLKKTGLGLDDGLEK